MLTERPELRILYSKQTSIIPDPLGFIIPHSSLFLSLPLSYHLNSFTFSIYVSHFKFSNLFLIQYLYFPNFSSVFFHFSCFSLSFFLYAYLCAYSSIYKYVYTAT